MKILVIGSGGREHALCWKIAQSPLVEELVCTPGNAGIAHIAKLETVKANDIDGLVALAKAGRFDLVVIGPEDPLAGGLVDRLREIGIAAFGPDASGARLESSKAFTKAVCAKGNVPTARFGAFTDPAAAKAFLDTVEPPYVLKADGLAAGKGVVITEDRGEAETEIDAMLSGKFGNASKTLVIEEFLHGEEASVFALCDGKTAVPLVAAQDHKRAHDGDKGPNTGGMGAYSPTPAAPQSVVDQAMSEMILPTLETLEEAGAPFSGVLYAGLMIDKGKARLIEYNVRFGDPECQIIMMRMQSDIVPYLKACAAGNLGQMPPIDWDDRPAVTVVMAAKGYPGNYEKGTEIKGLDAANALDGVTVFHAGTTTGADGKILASGGRVLNVTAIGDDLPGAIRQAYAAVDMIDWPEGFCRRDIGWRAQT
tara:strand:+ start:1764 stop:3035 length:1272 start_codon:yes stop_codon:yes gene_type:complete